MKKGVLMILSGPSGVGKSTVIRLLRQQDPSLFFSVSVTTRDRRPGEVEGEDYYFISQQEYDELVARDALLEHAGYVRKNYGTPAEPVDKALEEGRNVLLDIEPQGAAQVRAKRSDAVSVFISAPSFRELEARLRGRGDTTEEDIERRLEKAGWEYTQAAGYDYLVCNETPELTAQKINAILTAEGCRPFRSPELLEQ